MTATSSPNYFECPRRYNGSTPSVFLAGGVTGCPNWQAEMTSKILEECPGFVIMNPRRATFDVTDDKAHDEQIAWEYDMLRKASVVIFFYPDEGVCLITWFELGVFSTMHAAGSKEIMVGCDPKYFRSKDVKTQLGLALGPNFKIHPTLDQLFSSIKKWWEAHK